MTWSLQYKSRADFLNRTPIAPVAGDPNADQIEAAHEAARSMIDSGAVAPDDKEITVNLYGHSGLASSQVGASVEWRR